MRRTLILLIGLLASASAAQAQILSGVLMETDSEAPLPGGVMTLVTEDSAAVAQVQTDSVGAFTFTVPRRGSYRLHAEHFGYRSATSAEVTVGAKDTVEVAFSLARNAVAVEPLVVKARNRRITPGAKRFYERAESSAFGTFITRDEVARTHPNRTTDLFHRIPGVQTTPMMGGSSVRIRGNCRPSVYVNGTRINGYRSIDDLATPMELEGVEVYRSAHHAPPEFTGLRAGCAVVLIWTRIE